MRQALPRGVGVGLAAAVALGLAGCASLAPCRGGETPMVRETLYFGTAMPGGRVSAAQWRAFVEEVVTPRFPQGLTVWPASGQWRGEDGRIVREGSEVLELVHPDGAEPDRAVHEITQLYKSRFRQEAVLRLRAPACVSF